MSRLSYRSIQALPDARLGRTDGAYPTAAFKATGQAIIDVGLSDWTTPANA